MPNETINPQSMRKLTIDLGDPRTCLEVLRSILEAALPPMHARRPLDGGEGVLVFYVYTMGSQPVLGVGTRSGEPRRKPKELGCIPYSPELTVDTALDGLIHSMAGYFVGLWIEMADVVANDSKDGSHRLVTTMN